MGYRALKLYRQTKTGGYTISTTGGKSFKTMTGHPTLYFFGNRAPYRDDLLDNSNSNFVLSSSNTFLLVNVGWGNGTGGSDAYANNSFYLGAPNYKGEYTILGWDLYMITTQGKTGGLAMGGSVYTRGTHIVKLNKNIIPRSVTLRPGRTDAKGSTFKWSISWTRPNPDYMQYEITFYDSILNKGTYGAELFKHLGAESSDNTEYDSAAVYAQWVLTKKLYTITFKDHNNNTLYTRSLYPTNSTTNIVPYRNGYKGSWSIPSGSGTLSGSTFTLTSIQDLTITAFYIPINYTIEYLGYLSSDLKSGYTNTNPTSYNIETSTFNLSTDMFKDRVGYNRPTWFDIDNHVIVTSIPKGSTSDRRLDLKYDVITYNINYYLQGGSGSHGNTDTYNIESSTITLKQGNLAKTGYTFEGWYNSPSGGSKVTSIPKGSTGTKYLYARWKPIEYSISYNLNGGTIQNNIYYPDKYTIETILELNRNYVYKNGYDLYRFEIEGIPLAVLGPGAMGNKTIDIIWNLIYYNYFIYNHDGNILVHDEYSIEDSDIILDSLIDIPSWIGYNYKGIYDKSSGGNKVTKIPSGSTGNKNYYIQREVINYNISYDKNNGEGDHDNITHYNIESDNIVLKQGNMTRTGYTFLGWFDNNDNQVSYISKGSTGDISLQAKWQVINYTITLKDRLGNNYTLGNNSFNIETETFNISSRLANPTETGYTFEGWFEEAFNFSNEVTQVIKGTTEDIVLYSKWSIKEYSIRLYDENENHLATQNYTIESDDILLSDIHPDLSWNGYTFLGWYTASTGGSKVTKVSSGSTGNKKYYAQRSIITYRITYDLQNGSGSHSNPESYTVEDKVTLTQGNIFREGYEFLGWYNSPTKGSEVTEISKGSYGDVVVYARWNLLEYTITYQLNGGVNNEGNPTKYTPITDDITFLKPTRPHYIFVDWKINNTVVFGIPKGSTGNKTVVASWTPQPYLIDYVLQGGSGSHGNKTTYNIEQQVNFVQGSLRRSGYTFKGWYDSPTGGNKVTVFNVGTSGNKTLYAQWTEITYSITYTMNGGTNHIDNPNSFTPETNTIILKNPTRTGYTFNGWYEGNTKITNIPKGSIGNKTIEARWTIITYSIKYELNGGSGDVSNPLTYTIETADINLSSSGVTRLGYNFNKFTSAGSTITKIPKGSIGDRTITYNWTEITYSVTFDADGGSPVNNITYNVNTPTITLPNTSKDGYTFSGWFEGGVRYTNIPKGSVGNRNFKAVYNINSYNIIFKNQDDVILQQGEQIFNNNLVFNQTTPTYTPTQNKIMSVFKFVGWSTNKNANPDQAKTLAQLGTNNNGKISSDMNNYTLYAIYSERVNSIRIGNSELKTTSTIGNKNIKEIRVGNKLVWEKDYK